MAKRVWRAKMNCQMPWRDFVKNETVELDDKDVTLRVKDLFECLTPEEVEAGKKASDPDLKVMVARLRAAKVPMKRGMSEDEIRELFNKFLGDGATAGDVAKAMN